VWWTELSNRQLFTAREIHTIVLYRIIRLSHDTILSRDVMHSTAYAVVWCSSVWPSVCLSVYHIRELYRSE